MPAVAQLSYCCSRAPINAKKKAVLHNYYWSNPPLFVQHGGVILRNPGCLSHRGIDRGGDQVCQEGKECLHPGGTVSGKNGPAEFPEKPQGAENALFVDEAEQVHVHHQHIVPAPGHAQYAQDDQWLYCERQETKERVSRVSTRSQPLREYRARDEHKHRFSTRQHPFTFVQRLVVRVS